MSLSDIIRVPFGYLLEWLYLLTHNYGVALILFGVWGVNRFRADN